MNVSNEIRPSRSFLLRLPYDCDLLQELNKRLTIVLVSHDFGFVSKIVKTVVCVKRRVTTHPTSEVTGEIINEIYGMDMRLVRHDHRGEGH